MISSHLKGVSPRGLTATELMMKEEERRAGMKATIVIVGEKKSTILAICEKALQEEGYTTVYSPPHVLKVRRLDLTEPKEAAK